MKKVLAVAIVGVLVLSLTGCSNVIIGGLIDIIFPDTEMKGQDGDIFADLGGISERNVAVPDALIGMEVEAEFHNYYEYDIVSHNYDPETRIDTVSVEVIVSYPYLPYRIDRSSGTCYFMYNKSSDTWSKYQDSRWTSLTGELLEEKLVGTTWEGEFANTDSSGVWYEIKINGIDFDVGLISVHLVASGIKGGKTIDVETTQTLSLDKRGGSAVVYYVFDVELGELFFRFELSGKGVEGVSVRSR